MNFTDAQLITAGLFAIGAGLAIGLPGIGVGTGQGHIGKGALEGMARNPEMAGPIRSTMFIAVALAETPAIYGLVISIILIVIMMSTILG